MTPDPSSVHHIMRVLPHKNYSIAQADSCCLQARELETRQDDLDMARAQTASLLEAQSQYDSSAQADAQRHAELEGHSKALSAQLQDFQQQVSSTCTLQHTQRAQAVGCLTISGRWSSTIAAWS